MCIDNSERGLLARYNMDDNFFPSKDIEKLIELWQQEDYILRRVPQEALEGERIWQDHRGFWQ